VNALSCAYFGRVRKAIAAISLNKRFHFGLAQGIWLQIGTAISSCYSKSGREIGRSLLPPIPARPARIAVSGASCRKVSAGFAACRCLSFGLKPSVKTLYLIPKS